MGKLEIILLKETCFDWTLSYQREGLIRNSTLMSYNPRDLEKEGEKSHAVFHRILPGD